MSCTGGAEGYKAVVELVHTETPPHICWRELLALTKQSDIERLIAIDVGEEITAVAQQLDTIWLHEPIPWT